MKLGAIDIGSNSCRLLIADVAGDSITPLWRDLDTTRMGEGVDAAHILSMDAVKRTIKCLKRFKEIMRSFDVKAYRIIATSAVREAENRMDFVEKVKEECGLQVDIISGEEEACLSYEGVKKGLKLYADPLVVDLGGGSTEFIWQGKKSLLVSLPVGAVRATEAAMDSEQIESLLAPLEEWKASAGSSPLVFVGGTATSMVAIKLALREYDSKLVHGQKLSRDDVTALYTGLSSLSREDLRKVHGLQEKRADIIVKGVLIALLIMRKFESWEMTVSESDLLDAVIWQLFNANSQAV